jgi:hypothetical protein
MHPQARVRRWIERLSGVDRIGVDVTDPVNRLLVEALLDGGGRREAVARLTAAYDRESVRLQAGRVEEQLARIERTVLAPLFGE